MRLPLLFLCHGQVLERQHQLALKSNKKNKDGDEAGANAKPKAKAKAKGRAKAKARAAAKEQAMAQAKAKASKKVSVGGRRKSKDEGEPKGEDDHPEPQDEEVARPHVKKAKVENADGGAADGGVAKEPEAPPRKRKSKAEDDTPEVSEPKKSKRSKGHEDNSPKGKNGNEPVGEGLPLTFARRYCPAQSPGKEKWLGLLQAWNSHVADGIGAGTKTKMEVSYWRFMVQFHKDKGGSTEPADMERIFTKRAKKFVRETASATCKNRTSFSCTYICMCYIDVCF